MLLPFLKKYSKSEQNSYHLYQREDIAGKSDTEEPRPFQGIDANIIFHRSVKSNEKKLRQTLHAENIGSEPTWRKMLLQGIHDKSSLAIGPINSAFTFHNKFQQKVSKPDFF